MNDILTIEGKEVRVTTPEGKSAEIPIAQFIARIAPRRIDTAGTILPDGVKAAFSEGSTTIWVFETPPRTYSFRWLANDSPSRFGRGAKYRTVRLALPYVILFVVFASGPDGQLYLTQNNECYFRTAPLRSVNDQLHFPALLNCSKMTCPSGRTRSWLCTQHVDFASLTRERDLNKRLRAGFDSLRHCLLETGFNYSSEHHEGASWFTASAEIDPRIATVENWEQASAQDPLFVLDVPWLPTDLNVSQLSSAIFALTGASRQSWDTATALARIVINPEPKRKNPFPWTSIVAGQI